MSFAYKVRNGGWGALFLWVYVLGILLWNDIKFGFQRLVVLSIAAVPSLVVMFLVEVYIDRLNDWWAGGKLKRSTEIAHQVTNDERPYEVSDRDLQERINEFDNKAFGKHVSIIAGLLIGLSAPFVGMAMSGLTGTVVGGLLAIPTIMGLSYRSFKDLNKLADGIGEVYMKSYEG